jgi:hypothetical protein
MPNWSSGKTNSNLPPRYIPPAETGLVSPSGGICRGGQPGPVPAGDPPEPALVDPAPDVDGAGDVGGAVVGGGVVGGTVVGGAVVGGGVVGGTVVGGAVVGGAVVGGGVVGGFDVGVGLVGVGLGGFDGVWLALGVPGWLLLLLLLPLPLPPDVGELDCGDFWAGVGSSVPDGCSTPTGVTWGAFWCPDCPWAPAGPVAAGAGCADGTLAGASAEPAVVEEE